MFHFDLSVLRTSGVHSSHHQNNSNVFCSGPRQLQFLSTAVVKATCAPVLPVSWISLREKKIMRHHHERYLVPLTLLGADVYNVICLKHVFAANHVFLSWRLICSCSLTPSNGSSLLEIQWLMVLASVPGLILVLCCCSSLRVRNRSHGRENFPRSCPEMDPPPAFLSQKL